MKIPTALIAITVVLFGASPGWGADPSVLPKGKDRALVAAQCGGCHSLRLVKQNRMSRKRWAETIAWMQQNHNLWEFPPKLRARVLDYLETYLGPTGSAGGEPGFMTGRHVNPLPPVD